MHCVEHKSWLSVHCAGQVQFAQRTGPGQQAITATGAVQTLPCNSTVTPTSLNMV